MTPSFFDHFSELPDPRIERCRQHELLDIVFLSVCAVLSGADGWEAIEEFGEAKLAWLLSRLGFVLVSLFAGIGNQ